MQFWLCALRDFISMSVVINFRQNKFAIEYTERMRLHFYPPNILGLSDYTDKPHIIITAMFYK